MKAIYHPILILCLALAAFFSLSSFGSVPMPAGGGGSVEYAAAQEDGRAPKKKVAHLKKKDENRWGTLSLTLALTGIGLYCLVMILAVLNEGSLLSTLLLVFLLPLFISAIVLGVKGIKQDEAIGKAVVGMVLGILFALVSLILFAILIAAL